MLVINNSLSWFLWLTSCADSDVQSLLRYLFRRIPRLRSMRVAIVLEIIQGVLYCDVMQELLKQVDRSHRLLTIYSPCVSELFTSPARLCLAVQKLLSFDDFLCGLIGLFVLLPVSVCSYFVIVCKCNDWRRGRRKGNTLPQVAPKLSSSLAGPANGVIPNNSVRFLP